MRYDTGYREYVQFTFTQERATFIYINRPKFSTILYYCVFFDGMVFFPVCTDLLRNRMQRDLN